MRRFKVFIFVFLLISINVPAQNLLSPQWKISFDDISEARQDFDTANWKDVNLLLSWERQGYFWHDGNGWLIQEFSVPAEYRDSKFILSMGLQCDVQSIFVNENHIGGNLPNPFWTNRDAKTDFALPPNCILPGKQNRIAIFVSNLSYTGGRSHNFCSITPEGIKDDPKITIDIPVDDHLYAVTDPAKTLELRYTAGQKGVIQFSIVNDFHESFVTQNCPVEKGEGAITVHFEKEITQPGFYECTAILDDGFFASDVRWFAVSPEKIACTNAVVPRFKSYWDETLHELRQVDPEFKVVKVDSLCSAYRDGYIAEMKSFGGLTIRGYYFVPRTSGKHAAVLHVPGYGYGWDHLDDFLASPEDVVELALCVRGHGISADVFNPGFGVPGVWGYRLCSETENAYRAIYMDCVRAVEFLSSRPEVYAARIGVMGGSQGGGLTLATAGLCPEKIKACAYFDPFPCDTRDQLKIRTICNHEIKNFLNYYHDECTFEEALNVQDLIDTKGFAGMIACPVFFATALFDDDCPPHMGFSAYNRISSPKRFQIFPEDSHLGESNPYAELMKFLKSELGF